MQKLVLGAFLGVEALLIGGLTTFHQELWTGFLDSVGGVAAVDEFDAAFASGEDDGLPDPGEASLPPETPLVPVTAAERQDDHVSGMIFFALDRGALDQQALDALDFLVGRAEAAGGEVRLLLTGLGGQPAGGATVPRRWAEGPVFVDFPAPANPARADVTAARAATF